MDKYKITICDELFGELTGEFFAKTKTQALAEAQEFYAVENGTDPENIQIVTCALAK